jgi:hypothetical protein
MGGGKGKIKGVRGEERSRKGEEGWREEGGRGGEVGRRKRGERGRRRVREGGRVWRRLGRRGKEEVGI